MAQSVLRAARRAARTERASATDRAPALPTPTTTPPARPAKVSRQHCRQTAERKRRLLLARVLSCEFIASFLVCNVTFSALTSFAFERHEGHSACIKFSASIPWMSFFWDPGVIWKKIGRLCKNKNNGGGGGGGGGGGCGSGGSSCSCDNDGDDYDHCCLLLTSRVACVCVCVCVCCSLRHQLWLVREKRCRKVWRKQVSDRFRPDKYRRLRPWVVNVRSFCTN